MLDIRSYLDNRKSQVESALRSTMMQAEGRLAAHIEAMRYSLFAGGKRIRPILCLAAAEAVQTAAPHPEIILAAACALECIHTYSLIHDDLPAMDNDDLRRGKPTNHKVFGEAGAILAGDGLLTFAFELLSNADSAGITDRDRLRVVNLISMAAGPIGMVGGQFLDLQGEGKALTLAELQEIHSRKTGALITASVQTGAILGQASDRQFEAISRYGRLLGLAFQIVDDLLNVEGTPEELGKATGSDAERNKATYPAFFGVTETRAKAVEAVDKAISALADLDDRADPLREIARYVLNRNK